jgi:hypothetical protein
MKKENDLTGKTFGRLTVLDLDKHKTGHGHGRFWQCKCICGNETSVASHKLKTGHTKSCGCWQKEQAHNTHFKDLTNKRFGKLTVLSRNIDLEQERRKTGDKQTYWNCKCDCGTIVTVSGGKLTSEYTHSCGCIKSYGEYVIRQILTKENIKFETNIAFTDCHIYKQHPLRFDFTIYNVQGKLSHIIEFDGQQHFGYSFGWNTPEQFQSNHSRDLIKNQYCFQNNIPIIRIPYTHLKNLNINDLLLETSSFVLSEENEQEYFSKYSIDDEIVLE